MGMCNNDEKETGFDNSLKGEQRVKIWSNENRLNREFLEKELEPFLKELDDNEKKEEE